ncbi:MAG: hypothetical protein SFU56_04870 [Capsulimonadales bacterium]|nr:hypothetical protein [Capsulimonadales bacterium]
MSRSKEIIRDRRLLIGGGVGVLLGIGGLITYGLADGRTITATSPMVAQVGAGADPEGDLGAPEDFPGAAPGGLASGPPAAQGPKPGPKFPSSFDKAPVAHPSSGGGGAAVRPAAGPFGAPPAAAAAGGAASGDPPTMTAPKPVVKGKPASPARPDPFVSYRIAPIEKVAAYNFISTARFAKYPDPPKPPENPNPEIEFGPLPFVPRRVAGILFNGSTSAILETAGVDYRVIAPGTKVPSGIAGLADLTVSAITPSQVTLRAEDGRTVSVSLSASATPLTGGPTGGFPGGAPGGFPGGGPGGFGGGRGDEDP